jgi:hypothetical protein
MKCTLCMCCLFLYLNFTLLVREEHHQTEGKFTILHLWNIVLCNNYL